MELLKLLFPICFFWGFAKEIDIEYQVVIIETEKYEAKPAYKKFPGYRPGVAVIGDLIVDIENSDGKAHQINLGGAAKTGM